ncbi:hypothetical protein B0H21DRAFT_826559 [Amylocystis lapponica]|nr:hypothetical protein B0H21DRAFT_826559 [Amylocystis lapponica]
MASFHDQPPSWQPQRTWGHSNERIPMPPPVAGPSRHADRLRTPPPLTGQQRDNDARSFVTESVHVDPDVMDGMVLDPDYSPRLTNPTRTAPVEEWYAWFLENRTKIPCTVQNNKSGLPDRQDIEAHLVAPNMAPIAEGTGIQSRQTWIAATRRLFSIAYLYEQVVQRGGYTRGTEERIRVFPSDATNMSMFNPNIGYGVVVFADIPRSMEQDGEMDVPLPGMLIPVDSDPVQTAPIDLVDGDTRWTRWSLKPSQPPPMWSTTTSPLVAG